jgi:hypothetical protein
MEYFSTLLSVDANIVANKEMIRALKLETNLEDENRDLVVNSDCD